MVIGDTFAWGHMRKTGGNATLTMFELFPHLINFADPRDTEEKHTSFAAREEAIAGKLLVSNIRRLPAMILSWSHHVNYWGHEGEFLPMYSPHQMSESSFADECLAELTDEGNFEVDRWLRAEALAKDFLGFVSSLTEVTEQQRVQILAIEPVNALRYDHYVPHWFSEEQIERMYENNPGWASIENEVYGRQWGRRFSRLEPASPAAPPLRPPHL
jgi:hypothetical protein